MYFYLKLIEDILLYDLHEKFLIEFDFKLNLSTLLLKKNAIIYLFKPKLVIKMSCLNDLKMLLDKFSSVLFSLIHFRLKALLTMTLKTYGMK